MAIYEEMQKEIQNFCNSYPPAGFEMNYLQNSKEILDLYAEASTILEESNNAIDENRLKEIYNRIKKLAH